MKTVARFAGFLAVAVMAGLVLGETLVFLQAKVAAIDADHNRAVLGQLFSAHWWRIAIVAAVWWVLRTREANRWFSGFRHGYVVARSRDIARSRADANRRRIADRLRAG